LPTNISSFVKGVAKETLALKFVEAIVVDKYFHVIGVIIDGDESKDSKETRKKSQPYSSKDKEKDCVDIESLTRSLKALTNEV